MIKLTSSRCLSYHRNLINVRRFFSVLRHRQRDDMPDNITETNDTENIPSSPAGKSPYPENGKSLTVDARRVDPTTVKQVNYFDSLSYVKALESKGFTRTQAEGMAETLTDIINTTLDHQSGTMVTKFQQKMAIDESNLRNVLKDEVSNLKGHVTLDINLERALLDINLERVLEAHAANEKKLQQLHNKIETDIANLKTVIEQYRNDVLKYAGGTVLTCATICLGFLRLWT